ncbi:MAG TPA: hypothetical protein ACQGQH_10640 [Xylella sp.]
MHHVVPGEGLPSHGYLAVVIADQAGAVELLQYGDDRPKPGVLLLCLGQHGRSPLSGDGRRHGAVVIHGARHVS